MAIMAPTPDQVFMGLNMQRGSSSSSSAADSVNDLTNILGAPPAPQGRGGAGIPGFGRYWARSSWSSCVVDNSHLGSHQQQQQLAPPASQMGIIPSTTFSEFGAGKFSYPVGHGVEASTFSVGKSCEPTSGVASSRIVQQPLLEAVEGVTEASTKVEAASAAAATHGHVEVTAQQQEDPNNSSCSGGGTSASPGATSPSSHDSHQAPARKRKKDLAPPDPKGGDGESVKSKRSKEDKARGSSSEASTESGSPKASKGKAQQQQCKEYSKQDYIHVRARRGQATDSHSLAERVRREKISERMKYLQDLVPGCKKVTGKAVMLDEIINYVQSLQRQVEQLSMKLASVNPTQPDLTLESLVSNKEMLQTHLSSILDAPGAMDVQLLQGRRGLQQQQEQQLLGGSNCGFDFRSSHFDLVTPRHGMSAPIADHMSLMMQRSFDNTVSQSTGWDGELQSVVQMGLNHHQGRYPFEAIHCQLPVGHMKVEF